jgi:hypothetical protein
MSALALPMRASLPSRQIRDLAASWLEAPREAREQAKANGLNVEPQAAWEVSIKEVAEKYLADFCRPGINHGSDRCSPRYFLQRAGRFRLLLT